MQHLLRRHLRLFQQPDERVNILGRGKKGSCSLQLQKTLPSVSNWTSIKRVCLLVVPNVYTGTKNWCGSDSRITCSCSWTKCVPETAGLFRSARHLSTCLFVLPPCHHMSTQSETEPALKRLCHTRARAGTGALPIHQMLSQAKDTLSPYSP